MSVKSMIASMGLDDSDDDSDDDDDNEVRPFSLSLFLFSLAMDWFRC